MLDRSATATLVTDLPALPPNQRGARWPALLIGGIVVGGAIYGAFHLRRSSTRHAPPAALADAGPGDGPSRSLDAPLAVPLDAAVSPAVPLDASARPRARDARPPSAVEPGPSGDELSRQLDDARRLVATDPDRALRMLDEILDEHRSARALLVRADALRRLGRVGDALGATDAAIAMSPRSGAAWELKGRILWDAGRRAEALPAYQRFLDLQPTGDLADTVRWRLSQQ